MRLSHRLCGAVGAPGVYYFFVDQVGSTRIVTDDEGAVCFEQDYYPYGQEVNTGTQSCPQSYKFTGYERDWETGLDYAFARYYNARLGRFMSVDPLAGELGDPQSLNRYAYVRNDPINFIDPTGLCTTGLDGIIRCTATDSGPVYTGGGGGSPITDSEDCWGGCEPAWKDQKKPKPRETKGVGQILSCAADTANQLSIAGVLNIDENAHPWLATLADATLGNTFSGVVGAVQHISASGDKLAAGAEVFGATVVVKGVGVPGVPALNGLIGNATEALIEVGTRPSSFLSLMGETQGLAVKGLAGPIGLAKLGIDLGTFIGSAIYCAAHP